MAIGDVKLPSDDELIKRAIRNARPSDRGSCVRWAAVSDTFALGSTYSIHLCRKHGFDPDEKVCLWMDDNPDEGRQ